MSLPDRRRTVPTSWLHAAGFVLVLWAATSDALAQVREVVVTEVQGNAVRATGAAPVRALDVLRAGERIRLSSDSQVGLFSATDAQLYLIQGPAEVTVGTQGVTSNGKPAVARKVSDAYRNVKLNAPDLVQGTMVMRGAADLRVLSPEGVVDAGSARRFTWKQAPGSWRIELSSDSGEVVYRADASDGALTLPAGLDLKPGVKYVWGILPAAGGAAPVDWTEFAIRTSGPAAPGPDASASEKLIHAAWLNAQGLERAAARVALTAAH